MGIFGGLFDFNRDGKLSPMEQTLELMFIDELLREEEKNKRDDLFDDDDDDFLW